VALWCQSIKCSYARAGTSARGSAGNTRVGALERSGPCPRGCLALERSGPRPRGRKGLERGGPRPRKRLSAERGGPRWRGICGVALVGCRGHQGCGCAVFVIGVRVDLCFAFFAGFKRVSPWLFRGPLWLSPTVAPDHLRVYPSGSRRCWSLLIGRPSLLVANVFPWGRISVPAGLAPEALQERECSCRGFFANFYQWAWYLFQPASAMFQPASVTRARLVPFSFGAPQEV
jgi:hypothetical protein